jgi:hypothetical protein
MPPGLTSGLDRDQFVNLIAFLTKLGEPGDFRVSNTRYVRRWENITLSKDLASKFNPEGSIIASRGATLTIAPVYSKVSGELPIDELAEMKNGAGKPFSILRFDIEALTKGNVSFALSETKGITAFNGTKPLKITNGTITADLSQGIQPITLVIDRNIVRDGGLKVELKDVNGGAQTRLKVGR